MERKKFTHLTERDRQYIENLKDRGYSNREIAEMIGVSIRAIQYEVKRGTCNLLTSNYEYITKYSWKKGQTIHDNLRKNSNRKAKISNDVKLKNYIETMLSLFRFSPNSILMEISSNNLKFDENIQSVNTIYNAIKKGYFKGISMKDLPMKNKRKGGRRKRVSLDVPGRTSIEKRDSSVLSRSDFGHWEMDCVEGKTSDKKVVLTLIERKTRFTIVEVLKEHTGKEVIFALNRIEKRLMGNFYKIVKSITVDNGHEFLNYKGLQKSLFRVGDRTKLYYCHPRHPEERGSNENVHLLLRRFLPKGTKFDLCVTRPKIKEIEEWINCYPRKLFDGGTSKELYEMELRNLGLPIRY